MISVVVATYNGANFIIKQLDSLRRQTLAADQVIIFDDCSTDNTPSLVKNYIQKYNLKWEFVINLENLGYKKNFLNGIAAATGDYIFLCDQDDEWYLDKIEKMVKIMEQNPDILALNSGTSIIDRDSNHVYLKSHKNYYNSNFLYSSSPLHHLNYYDLSYIIKHNISPGCSMAIRATVKNDFLQTYHSELPHDWHLNFLAASKNGCVFLNEALINYRCHKNNAIGANTGVSAGIRKKTRNVRIQDYVARQNTAEEILEYYNIIPNRDIKNAIILCNKMKEFYESPSPAKLFHLRRTDGYYELAKPKIRVWEFAVAFHLDTFIAKFFDKLGKL